MDNKKYFAVTTKCGHVGRKYYLPVTFQEDNLTSIAGYNSVLPADLLPLVFSIFGSYQLYIDFDSLKYFFYS